VAKDGIVLGSILPRPAQTADRGEILVAKDGIALGSILPRPAQTADRGEILVAKDGIALGSILPRPAQTADRGEILVAKDGIEPPTQGFSVFQTEFPRMPASFRLPEKSTSLPLQLIAAAIQTSRLRPRFPCAITQELHQTCGRGSAQVPRAGESGSQVTVDMLACP
jgi:hypothetical protein